MQLALCLLLVATTLFVLVSRRRRRPGEPFDWTHRRPWWRPRSIFPDDR